MLCSCIGKTLCIAFLGVSVLLCGCMCTLCSLVILSTNISLEVIPDWDMHKTKFKISLLRFSNLTPTGEYNWYLSMPRPSFAMLIPVERECS